MANTNIKTGYTYIAICNCIFSSVAWAQIVRLSELKPWLAWCGYAISYLLSIDKMPSECKCTIVDFSRPKRPLQ